jgi:branched-subunit amino acid transport protein
MRLRGHLTAISDRSILRLQVSKTREYDAQAMVYLGYVLYPLLAAYAVYSVLYNEHKGWYSFVLNTLVGAVYAFGFIMMCGPTLTTAVSNARIISQPKLQHRH